MHVVRFWLDTIEVGKSITAVLKLGKIKKGDSIYFRKKERSQNLLIVIIIM
jgi:hypothetical protein